MRIVTRTERTAPRRSAAWWLRSARRCGAAGTILLVLTGACSSIGARPHFVPLTGATIDTLGVEPDVVIATLQGLVVSEGLTVRVSSPLEGYLETNWYDTVTGAPGGGSSLDPRRAVRLRFFADRLGEDRTRLASEVVMRRAIDPSLPERENEVIAPPGHAGAELLGRLLAATRESVDSGAS